MPRLETERLTLRSLSARDATALVEALATREVGRYIEPCPSTAAAFRAFIRWTERERKRFRCFGIVPAGTRQPVGLIQIWSLGGGFDVAEWGFLVAEARWGTGLFMQSAQVALDFAFGALGVRRLEARSAVGNLRGNGVLRKLGAVPEGLLRQNFECDGAFRDHAMWAILADEWNQRRATTPLLP